MTARSKQGSKAPAAKAKTATRASGSGTAAGRAAGSKTAAAKTPSNGVKVRKTAVSTEAGKTTRAAKATAAKTAAKAGKAKKTTAKKVGSKVKTPEQILAEGLANGAIAQEVMDDANMQTITADGRTDGGAAPVSSGDAKPSGKSDVARILLPANMEMSGLEESFRVLRSNYPPTYKKCILDGADMTLIDTSGIQLLVNFVSSVKKKGCEVEWENYSIQAYQLANELGLVEQLGD